MKLKAWAVLTPKDDEYLPDTLRAYADGRTHLQFPIFPTKKEAAAWKAEAEWDRGRIVRVAIEVEMEVVQKRRKR